MYWRVRGTDWSTFTTSRNRQLLEAIVREERRPPGLVALDDDGTAIGWVSLAPREDYDRLEHSRVLARVDDEPVWSVVCFVVGKRVRGQGLARRLLDEAAAYAAGEGARFLEAYPVDTAGTRAQAASLYTGTVSMFADAGFELVTVRQANASSRPRGIYRRRLG